VSRASGLKSPVFCFLLNARGSATAGFAGAGTGPGPGTGPGTGTGTGTGSTAGPGVGGRRGAPVDVRADDDGGPDAPAGMPSCVDGGGAATPRAGLRGNERGDEWAVELVGERGDGEPVGAPVGERVNEPGDGELVGEPVGAGRAEGRGASGPGSRD